MRYRKEILRGIRMAAMVFACLLVVLISYRMLHGAPAEASPKAAGPVVRPDVLPKPPVAHAATADFEVPVPPSSPAQRSVHVHKTPPPVRQAAVAVPSSVILNGDFEPAPQPAPPAPVNEIVAAPAVVAPVQAAPVVVSPAPDLPPDAPPTPTNRKRGVLRSVGHFLHIGKRDPVQPTAMNQP
jgi:hypothetical protein